MAKQEVWTNKCANCDTKEWHGGCYIPDNRLLCDNCLMEKHGLEDKTTYDALDYLGITELVEVDAVIPVLAALDKQIRTGAEIVGAIRDPGVTCEQCGNVSGHRKGCWHGDWLKAVK